MNISKINFGTLNRLGAEQLCIVIDTGTQTEATIAKITDAFQKKNLEFLNALNGNEYAQRFQLNRGIVVYAKKHDPNDAEHSLGMDLGVTVAEAFDRIKKAFREIQQPYQISPLAYTNLQNYLESFKEIGLEAAKQVIPELEGIETLEDSLQTEDTKAPVQKNKESSRFSFYLIGIVIIAALAYLIRRFQTKSS